MYGADVRTFRERHRLNQEQMGKIVARSRSTIAAWESGAVPVDMAAWRLLALVDKDPARVAMLAMSDEDPSTEGADCVRRFLLEADTDKRAMIDDNAGRDRFLGFTGGSARMDADLEALLELAPDLQRMMTAGSSVAGGFLAGANPTQIRGPVVLPTSLAALGVRYIPVPKAEINETPMAVWTGLPTAKWLAEGEELDRPDIALRAMLGTYKTVGAAISVSRRLLKSAGGKGEAAVISTLIQALTKAMDEAILTGSTRTDQSPLGLEDWPEVNAHDGTSFDADDWRAIVKTLELAGVADRNIGVAASPAVKEKLSRITWSGKHLWDNDAVAGRPAVVSAALGAGSLIVGDFHTIEVSHLSKVHLVMTDMNSQARHDLFAFLDVSVAIPHPGAFLRVINI